MSATPEGTARFAGRFAEFDAGFFRDVLGLRVSSLGIGTHLGEADDEADDAYTEALIEAGNGGINFFDTAINYRGQRSERCIGAALKQLNRDEIVVCTKAGFLTPGALPASLDPDELVGGMHSISPLFLADQIDRSCANLGVDTIDVFYLHSPETQLAFRTREAFDARMRRAFAGLERQVEQGKIRYYGVATWGGFRSRDALSLPALAQIALEEGGPDHHFRFIQLPFNLGMVEAFVDRPENVLEEAARLGIAVVASGSLMQTRLLDMPDVMESLIPGLDTPAQRAVQFTRSTPGIAVALAGMGRATHVAENLGVARVPPMPREQYMRLYQ
jgi:aryl-alcohol dehydrogenase-like predicted oxidoreductase